MELNELVKERINENEKLFTKEELMKIKENFNLTFKIYFLGILDKI